MLFRRVYNKFVSLYNSIFRPPSHDVAIMRRERLSIVYGVSMFALFLLTSFAIFKSLLDPETARRATLTPPPGAKVYRFEIDPVNFTIKNKSGENEKLEKGEVTDDRK